jgi:ABC-type branched-subunit amino acid transport system substrate-binding protein
VTKNSILLGAVTVDSGPGASFLQPEDVAMQAVATRVNNAGGICGRQLKLDLHDSGWDAQTGLRYIQNLVEGDKVFALAVNPDSEGLAAASSKHYLADHKVPAVGTDGLLYSQYQDPYVWPIAASTVTAMHAIAASQHKAGRTNFSLVYESTYRFGREGANAYNSTVRQLTGHDIPGYRDPDTDTKCVGQFCGIVANQQGYGSDANTINMACSGKCDAGAVLLEPTTAITWFSSGGVFGGVADPSGGKGAAPQPLFDRYFADGCQHTCDGLRLWTGFLPPIQQFASQPGVQDFVHDMQAYSSNVDIDNQFAEGAYLGMRLTVDVLTQASAGPGGLTRDTVAATLDATSNYDIGLTVKPLSWSPGNHFAATTVHAFDESYPAGFGGWQYVQGSITDDADPTHI